MPQDSTKVTQYNGTGDTVVYNSIDEIPDSATRALVQIVTESGEPKKEPDTFSLVIGWLFLGALLFAAGWIMLRKLVQMKNIYLGMFFIRKSLRRHVAQLLEREFPYYNRLTKNQQDRFVRRVICFTRSKEFRFQDVPYNRDSCYLVSASAVQLSFGLSKFMLRYFTTIHLISGEYRHFAYATPFQGHTSDGEIYLSWPHFKHGYTVGNDNQNVGLHEMAHALTWECFYANAGGDTHFRETFPAYSAVGRPLFQRMQQGERNLLGDYAATRYDEFWATSVEVFFEQPARMKEELPELYRVMCRLLKQYPDDLFVIG